MKKSNRWSLGDLQKLRPGSVTVDIQSSVGVKKSHVTAQKTRLGLILYAYCQQKGWTLETEVRFNPDRKFRFDWAIPEIKVAVEYEGLMSAKSGHTTISGYTKDCDKYNSAQILGWTVLRYTALNFESVAADIHKIINNH